MAFRAKTRLNGAANPQLGTTMTNFGSITTIFNWSARAVGWLGGDAAMLGVVALSGRISNDLSYRYFFSVSLIAVGAYFLFGWPQLRLWRRERMKAELRGGAISDGPRMGFAKFLLNKGGVLLFVAAAALEGPLLIGVVGRTS